jgi:hypothetical protein
MGADKRQKQVQAPKDKLEAFDPIVSLKALKKMTVDGDRGGTNKGTTVMVKTNPR